MVWGRVNRIKAENISFCSNLQIAAQGLFSFDGFKEGFEVALTKAARAVAFDDFVEDGGAIFDGLRLFLAFGRFVDGEFDLAVAVLHHFEHEGGIFGGDVFVVEVGKLAKPTP